MSKRLQAELTWTKAVVLGLLITGFLLVTLAWIPSYFTYWWGGQTQAVLDFLDKTFKREFEAYTSVRIRDAISMGYQTTVFAGVLVAAYIFNERKRRRLGQRGADDVKGYLPGK